MRQVYHTLTEGTGLCSKRSDVGTCCHLASIGGEHICAKSVGDIALNRRLAKINVNKVQKNYYDVLILVDTCSFRCTLSLY